MPQVVHDPQKLRDFCRDLENHVKFWRTSISALDSYTSRLGKTWRDPHFEEFRQEVLKLRASLDRFSGETRQVTNELIRDAERLETYQRLKL